MRFILVFCLLYMNVKLVRATSTRILHFKQKLNVAILTCLLHNLKEFQILKKSKIYPVSHFDACFSLSRTLGCFYRTKASEINKSSQNDQK